jgi:SAM-dependent methyltransferase
MLTGAWVTQLVAAAVRLNIPDQLSQTPRSVDEIAKAVAADVPALRRAMRALDSVGVVASAGRDRYTLTPVGVRLRVDAPDSMRDFFIAETDDVHRRSWDQLVDAIKTGKPRPQTVFGMAAFEYYGAHPDEGAQFGRAMANVSAMSAAGVLDHYDFGGARTIVDVGGGNGSFVRAILGRVPGPDGVIFDLPYIAPQANDSIELDKLSARCRFEAGDFFQEVTAGADLYLLRFVLHDWNDEASQRILTAVRKAIAPGGRLLVVEMLVPEPNEPGMVQLMDMNMLVMTGGLERTKSEYEALLAAGKFRLTRVISTGTPFVVMEAEPI